MADGVTAAVANAALNAIIGAPNAAFIELHTGAPGSAGTANTSSVTTRVSTTWNSASAASVTASNSPAYTNWAGTSPETITDVAFWSLIASGTFGLSMALTAAVTMLTGDSLTFTSLTISIPTAS